MNKEMKIITKRAFAPMAVAVAALCLTACGNGQFKIEGNITEAADSMLRV